MLSSLCVDSFGSKLFSDIKKTPWLTDQERKRRTREKRQAWRERQRSEGMKGRTRNQKLGTDEKTGRKTPSVHLSYKLLFSILKGMFKKKPISN